MLYTSRKAQHPEFEAFFVITEDTNANPPTASYCRQIRQQYGLTQPVLYDRDGDYLRTLRIQANHVHWVLTRGARVAYVRPYDDDAPLELVDQELAR